MRLLTYLLLVLTFYEGLLHEVLFERRAPRELATADVVAFVSSRLAAARGAPPPSKL